MIKTLKSGAVRDVSFCGRYSESRVDSGARGFTMIELMVGMVILSVAGLALLLSFSTALRVAASTQVHNAASNMAASRVEELAAVPPSKLNSSYNETAASLTQAGLSNVPFLRSTAITLNADSSRTIEVRVWSATPTFPTSVTFRTRFASWE